MGCRGLWVSDMFCEERCGNKLWLTEFSIQRPIQRVRRRDIGALIIWGSYVIIWGWRGRVGRGGGLCCRVEKIWWRGLRMLGVRLYQ